MQTSFAAFCCLAFLGGQGWVQPSFATEAVLTESDALQATSLNQQSASPSPRFISASTVATPQKGAFDSPKPFPLMTSGLIAPASVSSADLPGVGAVASPGQDADSPLPSVSAPLSQATPLPATPPIVAPDPAVVDDVQTDLDTINQWGEIEDPADFSAPSLTIANPSGFGLDQNTFFISGTFQERTRYSNSTDGGVALGVGLFDSRRAVGAEISYTLASFGGSRDFGTGGFNLKVHRRFTESLSAAVGWNGFLTIGEGTDDFEDSVYGSVTNIFRIREDINQPFSRIAITAGAGTGQFRLEEDVADDTSTVNPFGSIAVRIVEPVSFITEWTGQDLALGVSVAPFNNVNFVITPALRDITGAGDGARFVLGFGTSFQF